MAKMIVVAEIAAVVDVVQTIATKRVAMGALAAMRLVVDSRTLVVRRVTMNVARKRRGQKATSKAVMITAVMAGVIVVAAVAIVVMKVWIHAMSKLLLTVNKRKALHNRANVVHRKGLAPQATTPQPLTSKTICSKAHRQRATTMRMATSLIQNANAVVVAAVVDVVDKMKAQRSRTMARIRAHRCNRQTAHLFKRMPRQRRSSLSKTIATLDIRPHRGFQTHRCSTSNLLALQHLPRQHLHRHP
jgi:hypothetical protein